MMRAEPDSAIKLIDKYLNNYKKDMLLLLFKSYIFQMMGRLNESYDVANQLVKNYPSNYEGYQQVAELKRDMGKYMDSLKYYDIALSILKNMAKDTLRKDDKKVILIFTEEINKEILVTKTLIKSKIYKHK